MKLYDFTGAPNPRRVRIFLAEKNVTVPLEQVDLRYYSSSFYYTWQFDQHSTIRTRSTRL
jgi:hypothetical protein